jgi:insulysin
MGEDIIKSPNDDRDYRFIQLHNQLKCLLVSDPTTDMAAASLDVNVGAMWDPRDAQGLAHFCEHMLFLGTEKYPEENYYNSFLSNNAGYDNAYTDIEDTNYYFTVAADKLQTALDIFGQFFISPLFTPSSTERELKAVDSENAKNLNNDLWRFFQLVKSTSKEGHQFNHFGTGNLSTLDSPDILNKLKLFYDSHYSANIMGLVVYGKEDLNILQSWVEEIFNPVVNKQVSLSFDETNPLDATVMGTLTKVVPVMDKKEIKFLWSCPPFREHYKVKPQSYLSHLLGHEGKNSILSMLKAENLAQELSAGTLGYNLKNFSVMFVGITLTDLGLEKYTRVIEIVQAYVNMLKERDVQEWVFDEIKKLNQAEFESKSKKSPAMFVTSMSNRLHRYPPNEIFTGPELVEAYDPDLIRSYINSLTVENLRIYLVARKFESECDQVEKWYGTKYHSEPFPADLSPYLHSPEVRNSNLILDLPPRNPYIPDSLSVLAPSNTPYPTKLSESESIIWHKQDDTFKIDKTMVKCLIYCNDEGYNTHVKGNLLGRLWRYLFHDSFREHYYLADQAGISTEIFPDSFGLVIEVKGFSQHLGLYFADLMKALAEYQVKESDRENFRSHWESMHDDMKNHFYLEPRIQCMNRIVTLKSHGSSFPIQSELEELEGITFEDCVYFSPRFLKKVRFEWLVMGNITSETAIELVRNSENVFKSARNPTIMKQYEIAALHSIKVPKKPVEKAESTLVYEDLLADKTNNNSSIISEWQISIDTYRNYAILSILDVILSEPCFDILRTKEQLGYVAHSFMRYRRGVLNYAVMVQSSKYPPAYLNTRISNFLDTMREEIRNMTDEKFESYRTSALKKLTKKDISLSEQFSNFGQDVISGSYRFDKKEVLGNLLPTITKEELQAEFEKHFYAEARRLDVEICCESMLGANAEITNNMKRDSIVSIQAFKNSMDVIANVFRKYEVLIPSKL